MGVEVDTNDSIQSLLKQASDKLEQISDSAYFDAELLLAHSLGKNRTYLHTWPEKKLSLSEKNTFHSLIEKRLTDYPVAYLLGSKPFWTMDLIVTPDVLIPRPETELLVETALDKIQNMKSPRILDLGTGSGAIALAIASERSDALVTAVDCSAKALAVAKLNATEFGLTQQLTFIQSDWFNKVPLTQFDLIVSNPPYIDPEDSHLRENIRYEPQQALVADNHGMSDIEKIIQKSHPFLTKGGFLMLEHGFDQHDKTIAIFIDNNYQNEQSIADLNGNWRVTLASYNS